MGNWLAGSWPTLGQTPGHKYQPFIIQDEQKEEKNKGEKEKVGGIKERKG